MAHRIAFIILFVTATPAALCGGEGQGVRHWPSEAAAFVAEATGRLVPSVAIRRAPADTLQRAVFGVEKAGDHPAVAALFRPDTFEIVVADDLRLADPLDLSYLVHEMVHAQQHAEGRTGSTRCLGALEAEAYTVQARFLRSRQLPREALLVDILGLMMGSCSESR